MSPVAGESFDTAVVGAGAAGLMAAIRAAERGRRTLLLEKNPRPGVKILISGGTRCNLTNARASSEIAAAFGDGARFLGPALRALDPSAVVRLFEAEGVATKVEDDVVAGKVFPVSDRATDVLGALLRRLGRSGAALRTGSPARAIEPATEGGFRIRLAVETEVRSARVIVTTGGVSYPKCGTTGDGYGFARALGHAIVEPRPALVPLLVEAPYIRELSGIALPARLRGKVSGALVAERRGPLLFTHTGLSGPAVLDLSSPLARTPGYPRGASVEIDFVPDLDEASLERAIREAQGSLGARLVVNALPCALPERLVVALATGAAGVPRDRRTAELSKDERRRLVAALKRLELEVSGDRGFGAAEVTSGGVALGEVDPKTLESRRIPGLHFAGEVLDLDGPIGGFNFQAAWSTGWLAGSAV